MAVHRFRTTSFSLASIPSAAIAWGWFEQSATMKLQLGTSRLDKLSPAALEYFLKPGWVHLGDDAGASPSFAKAGQLIRDYGPINFIKICWTVLRRKLSFRRSAAVASAAASGTKVHPFYYQKGDVLTFPDGEMHFVYAEHFFEHLFLDEALALLRKVHRVLAPGGVVRIVSPDADLRTEIPVEPAGFPYPKRPYTHPEKHKTRWSVHSLSEALRLAGFRPLPLRYHDRHGKLHEYTPASMRNQYPARLPEEECISTLAYVQRPQSLIVDGVREA